MRFVSLYILILFNITAGQNRGNLFISDNLDGTYSNPVIYSDYSDPDAIRVKNDFYLVASSFSHFPGLPVLHSLDLVNWEIIGHAVQDYPFKEFQSPQHGKGIWAPALRYHNGYYWIFFGDPDHGILMTKSKNPTGPWEPLHIVEESKGWIDPCPFWDENGEAYLVHAWAKSRSGINSILTLHRMSPEGDKLLDEGIRIFDGHKDHPTIEGPKLYKRGEYYYIFAPAGGVKTGWQTVLRSKNIYGSYESRIVMEQGSTNINGPHQGALIELESGENWFLHFQDRVAYGRVVHLNPVQWQNGWPVIGLDFDGNGIGEPVHVYNKPGIVTTNPPPKITYSDEFNLHKLGKQWQWEALPKKEWFSLEKNKGYLRLFCQTPNGADSDLRNLANVIAQKFSGEEFSAEVKISLNFKNPTESGGLIVIGKDYSILEIGNQNGNLTLSQKSFYGNNKEFTGENISLSENTIYLKVYVKSGGVCSFAYSTKGKIFEMIGNEFTASPGTWVGAKIGFYARSTDLNSDGFIDIDYIRINKS